MPTRVIAMATGVAASLGLVVLLVPPPEVGVPTGAVAGASGAMPTDDAAQPAGSEAAIADVVESPAPSPVAADGSTAPNATTAAGKTGKKTASKTTTKVTKPKPATGGGTAATPAPPAPGASAAPKPTAAPTAKPTPKPTPAPTPVPSAASGKP